MVAGIFAIFKPGVTGTAVATPKPGSSSTKYSAAIIFCGAAGADG